MGFPWRPSRVPLVAGPVGDVRLHGTLGFVGSDLAALRPVLAVAEGQRVAAGSRLLSDRRRPWIVLVAPVAGEVVRLEPGPRRGISALEIRAGGDEALEFDTTAAGSREGLIALMVQSGLWTALRARPFGRVPNPATTPDALFVTATEARRGAPDAAAVIAEYEPWFRPGLAALTALTPGRTWLCHRRGHPPPQVPGVTPRGFPDGPGGLPGAHVHALHPVAHGGSVWQIGWQDVIALGCLLETGRIWRHRIVALSGSGVLRPELLAVPPGARLHDIAAGRLIAGSTRLVAGGAEDGLPVPFLRRDIRQVTALRHRLREPGRGWLRQLAHAARPALIPNALDERLAPPGIAPVPFLRALAAGDVETARRLGALGLIEEDLALLNARFGRQGTDYTALLRQTLDDLEAEA
ncbi:hypothetical protein [Paenirhodobacter populi]|uniref:Uncharacterized protein n=1 Tax=Paenirhodobacter populi TaxID=2306993 RepID=A0A443JLQ8_9RHOB|nr:hypothetical protein [Sinirhodobacter populi]RWR21176.1 hypothetical protein D2T30_10065 [Sinirhodobacter populi]